MIKTTGPNVSSRQTGDGAAVAGQGAHPYVLGSGPRPG